MKRENITKNIIHHCIKISFKLEKKKREDRRHLQFGSVDLSGWFKVKFESGKVSKYFFHVFNRETL